MADGAFTPDTFIERWKAAAASERANAQLFLTELADLLAVPLPENSHTSGYTFEFPVKIPTGPGESTDGRIDLYRRGCFVLEAKQFVAPKPEQTDLPLAALASGAGAEGKRKSGPMRDSTAWDDGGLFEAASVLPLDGTQLGILIKASTMQWKDVEPAIFGTLLERALDPEERHQLAAHYTPRAYVERLVLPTVIEPLRAEWQAVRAAALVHAQDAGSDIFRQSNLWTVCLSKSKAPVHSFS